MTEEVFRVEGYWRPRAEGARSCALRLAQMLDGLAEAHPAFANWNKQTGSRAAANKPAWATPPEIDELTAVFEKGRQYKDIPREPWPEMGYGVNVERARSSLRSVIDPPSWGVCGLDSVP